MTGWYGQPFEDRYQVAASGCWEWQAGHYRTGYGSYRQGYAHRFSWELHHGPIPDGLLVCHTCDNRNCVNPDHLFLGTAADNNRDMAAKGRAERGETHHNAKLTTAAVIEIRSLRGAAPASELGPRFGVHPTTIRCIWRGAAWQSVQPRKPLTLGLAS